MTGPRRKSSRTSSIPKTRSRWRSPVCKNFWRDPKATDDDAAVWWTTCTIITTEATDAAGRVHPRMSLTIAEPGFVSWLDPAREDPDEIRALLADPKARPLDARAVTTAVNSVRNNGPHLLDAAPPTDTGS